MIAKEAPPAMSQKDPQQPSASHASARDGCGVAGGRLPLVIDGNAGMGFNCGMATATQETLFDMPEPSRSEVLQGWQSRMDKLTEMAQSKGGLMPRSVVHDTLGIHRSRVGQLVDEGRLEVVNFFGVQFVTGRSLREYEAAGKLPGGRGKKANGLWKNFSIGARIGSDLGHAIGLTD